MKMNPFFQLDKGIFERKVFHHVTRFPDNMDKVTRIGVSLEPELLNSFDNYISRKGYPTQF